MYWIGKDYSPTVANDNPDRFHHKSWVEEWQGRRRTQGLGKIKAGEKKLTDLTTSEEVIEKQTNTENTETKELES